MSMTHINHANLVHDTMKSFNDTNTNIMTPIILVRYMVRMKIDSYKRNSLSNEPVKVIDRHCGRGTYLIEAVAYLMEGDFLKSRFPNEQDRCRYIVENEIYGADICPVMCALTKSALEQFCGYYNVKNLKLNIKNVDSLFKNVDSLLYNWGMEFEINVGNPPYQATAGYKTSADFEDVDGKYGKKQLYYYFTKLGIEQMSHDGILSLVMPKCWQTSDDGSKLRLWLRSQNIELTNFPIPEGGEFVGVMTDANIQVFKRNLTNSPSQFHGPNAIYTTTDWQRAWLDAVEAGHTLTANRGGFKEVEGLPLITTYDKYKRGVTTSTRPVAPLKTDAERLIVLPEFLAPFRNNFEKAIIVEAAPFSDGFIGIYVNKHSAASILKWIQSEQFFKAMSWLKGSSHGGSLCQYFITEEAFNKYVKEYYEAEERIPH